MDETLVFVKTPKGAAEVTLRVGGLSLQARRVLIMIDGARSLAELAPLVPTGQIDSVIALLQSRGLVQASSGPEAEAFGPRTVGGARAEHESPDGLGRTTATEPFNEERVYLTIDEVKRRAVRELNERLGPDAEAIAMRIERCATVEELRERLREAERLVARTVSEASAQDFVRAMRRK